MFQFTRPRGARHAADWLSMPDPPVSIHAPARGATVRVDHFLGRYAVSIHAPARGATQARSILDGRSLVSIHAPARGANALCGRLEAANSFNSRAREGRDNHQQGATTMNEFQFTRPRGARLTLRALLRRSRRVSIHAPARGATKGPPNMESNLSVSIHAPARGATEVGRGRRR